MDTRTSWFRRLQRAAPQALALAFALALGPSDATASGGPHPQYPLPAPQGTYAPSIPSGAVLPGGSPYQGGGGPIYLPPQERPWMQPQRDPVLFWSRPTDWFAAAEPTRSPCSSTDSQACGQATVCCPTNCTSRFTGGIELLWMRASFDQNVAFIIDPPVGNTLVPFDYSMELTPRVWLGWQSPSGGGFRATYLRFRNDATDEAVTAVAGATPVYVTVYGAGGNLSRSATAQIGQTLHAQHRIKLETLDLEATQQLDFCSLRGTVAGGFRLAQMDQHFAGDVRLADGTLQEAVANDLSFEGVGPTASLQLIRPIGMSRLAIYGGLRGSLLMSETDQSIYEMQGAYTTELADIASQREIITAVEMAMGLQWNHTLSDRCDGFLRAGYECQAWFDAGGPVDAHSTIGLDAIVLAAGVAF